MNTKEEKYKQEIKKYQNKILALEKELKKLQYLKEDVDASHSQILHRDKMASIGQLAAGIAHELNNPVGFVSSNFETLEKNAKKIAKIINNYRHLSEFIDDPERQKQLFHSIKEEEKKMHLDFILDDLDELFGDSRKGFDQISKIITSLRNFSRIDDFDEKTLYNINDGLNDTLVIAKNEYKYHADIEKDLGDIPLIFCSPGMLNQVFLIIIINAAQALSNRDSDIRGHIRIKTYATEKDIVCEISNDGPVIEKSVMAKMFDPFFTTKETGKGTGLGLSIAYDIIVNKHSGNIYVESEPSKDTKFTITLSQDLG